MSTREELQQRIAAARAERERLEAEQAEAAELAALELEAKTEEAMAKAVRERGAANVRLVPTITGVCIVGRPSHLAFREFTDSGKVDNQAAEKLVRASLVEPDGKAAFASFLRMVEQEPALLMRAANAACELAGVRAKEAAGKS